MKIFDFEALSRGAELANVKKVSWSGQTYYDEADQAFVHINIKGCDYHTSAGHTDTLTSPWTDVALNPRDFGVECICFCIGQFNQGQDSEYWDWQFVCTPEFFEANKQSILSYETSRHSNK